jgi:hypothetical protein
MRRVALLLLLAASSSGCMEHQLRDKAVTLTATTTDLFYMQVLNNVALTIDDPAALPHFDVPASATAQIQRSISANYNPTWGVLATVAPHMRLTSEQGMFGGQQINQESWQMSPTADPDRLVLMHCAYLKATGHADPGSEKILGEYYSARDGWVDIAEQQVHYSSAVWEL